MEKPIPAYDMLPATVCMFDLFFILVPEEIT